MKPLSTRLSTMAASSTMAVDDRARKMAAAGRDVVSLGTGDPDFATPAHIIEAAHRAMLAGDTHYPPSRGTRPLLEAISQKLRVENGATAGPDQIVVTPGAKWALYLALAAVLNPGDEVLVLEPAWVSYVPMVALNGGVPVTVSLAPDDFRVTEDALRAALSPRTKAIIVNSPGNPTGRVLDAAEVAAIAAVAVDAGLYVISDEIYEHLAFDGRRNICLMADPRLADRTLVVNGFSKAYAMTGWRLGWLAAPAEVITLALRLQSQTMTAASSISMAAGVAALTGPQECVADMTEEYARRRNLAVARLNDIPGFSCPAPEGAFYLLPAVGQDDDVTFAQGLLEDQAVAVVPGSAFGEAGRGRVRLTLAASWTQIERALDRMAVYAKARPLTTTAPRG
jgi:aspartate aminotransferase